MNRNLKYYLYNCAYNTIFNLSSFIISFIVTYFVIYNKININIDYLIFILQILFFLCICKVFSYLIYTIIINEVLQFVVTKKKHIFNWKHYLLSLIFFNYRIYYFINNILNELNLEDYEKKELMDIEKPTIDKQILNDFLSDNVFYKNLQLPIISFLIFDIIILYNHIFYIISSFVIYNFLIPKIFKNVFKSNCINLILYIKNNSQIINLYEKDPNLIYYWPKFF